MPDLNLFEHLDDCSPVDPCAVCHLVSFLKEKLGHDNYVQFRQHVDVIVHLAAAQADNAPAENDGADEAAPDEPPPDADVGDAP